MCLHRQRKKGFNKIIKNENIIIQTNEKSSWRIESINGMVQTTILNSLVVGILFLSSPISCYAATFGNNFDDINSLPCPQSFSAVQLGIQNIIPSSPSSSSGEQQQNEQALMSPQQVKNSKLTCRENSSYYSSSPSFKNNSDQKEELETVRAIVYLPSTTSSSLTQQQVILQSNDILTLMVSEKQQDDKSLIIGGTKIPVSDISSFPISVSVLLGESSAASTTLSDSNLYVTARICSSTTTCNNASAKFFGQGISKVLLLPFSSSNDDHNDIELKPLRAAASIRLVQSTSPDRLMTW
jgi:hypothetical protein